MLDGHKDFGSVQLKIARARAEQYIALDFFEAD